MSSKARKPLVIVTRKLPDVVETRMRELFDARLNVDDKPMSQSELIEAGQKADVLVPTVTDRIERTVLSQAPPQRQRVANLRTRLDHSELETGRHRGITLTR